MQLFKWLLLMTLDEQPGVPQLSPGVGLLGPGLTSLCRLPYQGIESRQYGCRRFIVKLNIRSLHQKEPVHANTQANVWVSHDFLNSKEKKSLLKVAWLLHKLTKWLLSVSVSHKRNRWNCEKGRIKMRQEKQNDACVELIWKGDMKLTGT